MKAHAIFGAALLAAPALLLAACGGADSGADETEITDRANEEGPNETGVAVDGIASEQVKGADAAIPVLEPMGTALEVDLGPTLGGCSFEHEGDVLFIAGAEDNANARGKGVVQIGGRDRVLAGAMMGGPEMIENGPTMTDGEYTVVVERNAGNGEAYGTESTRYPAELVVRKDAANEVRYAPGTWTCGV